jgi:hypothetical protein
MHSMIRFLLSIYRIAGYFGGDLILAHFGDFLKFTKIKIDKIVMYIMFYKNEIRVRQNYIR